METRTEATIEDLIHAPNDEGTYELVDGKLVHMPPTGFGPGRASGAIYFSLVMYEREKGAGYAVPDNVGFIVNLPHRRSFSPDAAFIAQRPENLERFVDGAPLFAAEVRSEFDHGAAADAAYEAKRADYFAAGTRVVWDVDLRTRTVMSYRADRPTEPVPFRSGEIADAEPALPGWRIAVDDLFR
jgi:Uma2 family endonuclease